MNKKKTYVIVALGAIAIAVLGITAVSIWPQLFIPARADSSAFDGFPHHGQVIDDGTYIVVKELIVKNDNGSVDFWVDESWNAIWIDVQAIDRITASWTVTPPDYPSGASLTNGTALPFMEIEKMTVDAGAFGGMLTPLYNTTTGYWTLNYDIQGGLAKVYIIQAELKNI